MRPVVIGITGGIASGKSFVAGCLAEQGAAVVDADVLAHEVLRQSEVVEAAQSRWGTAILAADGQIDRRRLAEQVFAPTTAGAAELAWLEQLTHPRIRALAERQIAETMQAKKVPAVVIDAPLLVEAGWHGFCDKIVYVEAPRTLRLTRALARGWNQADFERREARQLAPAEKRQLADVVIDNSGTAESARLAVRQAWPGLVAPVNPTAAG